MQLITITLLACLVAMATSKAMNSPAVDALELAGDQVHEIYDDVPVHERSERNKRGLLLLKKKLLLGALGLKAAKVGVVGGAVAGAALAKSKSKPVVLKAPIHHSYGYSSHGPSWNVEVHSPDLLTGVVISEESDQVSLRFAELNQQHPWH